MEVAPLCRTLQLDCMSWNWFPGTLLFPTVGLWQQLCEFSSVQMLAFVVPCILSPGLHIAPTSHSPQCCPVYCHSQSILEGQIPAWRHSQRNMLSCAFQETAVYGEHIWFETNVSGDFCYVGEQNCMAKLLVSYMGLPAFTARLADAGFSATHPGDHKGCTAAAGGDVEGCQDRECVPPICVLKCCIFNFCRCWCSVCSGSLMQGCHSPRDYMMIFQGEAVGISHP